METHLRLPSSIFGLENSHCRSQCDFPWYISDLRTLIGLGTILLSVVGFKQFSKVQLVIGIMQFASSWLIIGYIWSIGWAVLIFFKKTPEEQLLKPGAGGQDQYNERPIGANPIPFEIQPGQ